MNFHVTTKDFLLVTSVRSRHQKGCRDTNSSSLGHDAKTMSRPHPVWPRSWAHVGAVVHAAARAAAPALRTWCLPVMTSKPGRDPVLEIGNSHSSFCLTQIFFSKPSVAFLLLLGCSSLTHCYLPTQNL